MKYFIIIFGLFLSSCGVYKYEYKSNKMLIVSKKGNPITRVIIKAEGGKELAQFEAIGGKSSKEFSLKDLSLENFSCTEGGSFMFETDKVYLIDPFPQGGDRVIRQTIKIKVEPDGSIVELKY